MSLFSEQAKLDALPSILAEKIGQMLSEIEVSGEETTADETVEVIEAIFTHLGRLWVAEYLHAIEQDADFLDEGLARDVFEMFRRNVTMGRWVGTSRRIRAHFVAKKRETVVVALAKQDFGDWNDNEHPVARLIEYRNAFSHGSMSLRVEEIREHRHLVEALLDNIPALVSQPIVFATRASFKKRETNSLLFERLSLRTLIAAVRPSLICVPA